MAKYICPQCYNEVGEDDKFCMNCGANLELIGRIEVKSDAEIAPSTQPGQKGFRITMMSMTTNETEERFLKEGSIVIGKSYGDWIIDDPSLSPRHAVLTIQGTEVIVEDAHSLNGIYKRVLVPTKLGKTEYILMGSTFLRFERLEPPDPTEARMYISPKEKYPIATLTVILAGARNGDTYPIQELPFEVGREAGDLKFPSDRFLSHRHMVIEGVNDDLYIRDLDSRNGTFLKIRERDILQHGDWLFMGRHLFRFEAL